MTVAAIPTPTPYRIAWEPAGQASTVGYGPLVVVTPSTAKPYVDCKKGSAFSIALTASITSLEFVNPQDGQDIVIWFATGAGSFTVSWAGVVWASGTAPTITSGASATDVIELIYNGTLGYWVGLIVAQNVS